MDIRRKRISFSSLHICTVNSILFIKSSKLAAWMTCFHFCFILLPKAKAQCNFSGPILNASPLRWSGVIAVYLVTPNLHQFLPVNTVPILCLVLVPIQYKNYASYGTTYLMMFWHRFIRMIFCLVLCQKYHSSRFFSWLRTWLDKSIFKLMMTLGNLEKCPYKSRFVSHKI